MVGLGEKEEEVLEFFSDVRKGGCDFLSIGQYLMPSLSHFPLKEYITPEKFDFYKREALKLGFKYVISSPYARSSYNASDYLSGSKTTKREAGIRY